MAKQIWDTDAQQQDLWQQDPARAARMAYLELMLLWHDQVEQGDFKGIPALEAALVAFPVVPSGQAHGNDQCTVRSEPNPVRHAPDADAGVFAVPRELRARWRSIG